MSAAPEPSARIVLRNKKALEQVQICLGVPAPRITDENRYATVFLNTVLGGGMSSRPFQTIREERGLAYSGRREPEPRTATRGTSGVYAGTSAGKALDVVDLILAEFRNLKETPVVLKHNCKVSTLLPAWSKEKNSGLVLKKFFAEGLGRPAQPRLTSPGEM